MFTTRSTILVPINTGFTSSLPVECTLLIASTELPIPLLRAQPFKARPLEGEHDCCFDLPLEQVSVEEDRALGASGLPLEAETGLSGIDGLDFTVGEVPRNGTGFFNLGPDFVTEEERFEGVDDRCVGVADLEFDLEAAGTEVLAVGVEERTSGLVGVEDRTAGTIGLVEGNVAREVGVEGLEGFAVVDDVVREVGVEDLEGFAVMGNVAREVGVEGLEGFVVVANVAREVGVEGLEGFVVAGNVARPVGVARLGAVDVRPDDDDSLLFAAMEEFESVDKTGCQDVSLFVEAGSGPGLASIDV